tara:strand:+ start:134 stop:889 length:756 start_codon:yes stop_codon:yes gene_type:complete
MKKITLIITTVFLIGACSQNNQEAQVEPQPMVEYTWMKAGSNFSANNLANLINTWNKMLDDMGCMLNGANILTPEAANQGYDFIWVHLWTSQSARDECWNAWSGSSYQEEWDKAIDGVMQYDLNNVYLFKPTTGRTPKKVNDTGSFVNSFFFCNFNDGYSMVDLESYRAELANINSFSDYHWYVLLEPTFEPAEPVPDFVWLDLWGSDEDKASDQAIWQTTDLPSKAQAMVSCNQNNNLEGINFKGTVIRS